MKNMNRQLGLTLIELMIAMIIGLILIAGAMTVMQSNRQAFNLSANLVRIQDNGRFSSDYLKNYLWRAGFVDHFTPLDSAADPQTIYFDNCGPVVPCSTDGVVSDVLTISYEVPSEEIAQRGSFSTCNGTLINAANINVIVSVADSFSVDPVNNNLVCQSYNVTNINAPAVLGAPLVLTGGIRGFQVLYGAYTDADVNTSPPTRFVYANATQINNNFNFAAENMSQRIKYIKYSFLVASDIDTGDVSRVTDTYYLLDANPIVIANGQQASVYTSTYLLRNGGS